MHIDLFDALWNVCAADVEHIDGLVQEIYNSSALAMELHLSLH